jgi:hypothetical protein
VRRLLGRSLVAAAVTAICAGLPAVPAAADNGRSDLAQVRAATAKYHDVQAAADAGYGAFLSCFSDPVLGGMGQHYVNSSLFGSLDPLHPQAMVYQLTASGLQLGAVEWIQPGSATDTPPVMFDTQFTYVSSLGVWVLHAWIWKPNPSGMFANYNPSVAQCPSS